MVGAASTSTSDNVVTPGADNDVIVLGTTVGVDVARSSNEEVVIGAGFGDDVIVNFAASGNGIDHLNFTSFGGTATAVAAVAPTVAAGQIAVVASVPATNGTAALLQTAFRLLDVAAGTAAKQVVVVFDAHNVGKVYSIANGAAVNDAIVTLEGSIDLADTAWGTLTLANFTAPTAFSEGASTAVVNTISATFNWSSLVGHCQHRLPER